MTSDSDTSSSTSSDPETSIGDRPNDSGVQDANDGQPSSSTSLAPLREPPGNHSPATEHVSTMNKAGITSDLAITHDSSEKSPCESNTVPEGSYIAGRIWTSAELSVLERNLESYKNVRGREERSKLIRQILKDVKATWDKRYKKPNSLDPQIKAEWRKKKQVSFSNSVLFFRLM